MKKIITVFLALIMLMTMSVAVFAETGGFVESPSNNQAPTLVEGTNESEDCTAALLITAYADRFELPETIRTKIEEAYDIIRNNPDLSALNSKLADIAADLGIKTTDLAVSDMFDISATDCNGHADHGHFDITLKADTLKNFVCLLHYYNGEWRVVEDAEVTQNGEHLEFTEDEFSPFAIVVSTAELGTTAPQQSTGSLWNVLSSPLIMALLLICCIIKLIIIIILIIILLKRKKKKDDEKKA